MIYDKQKNSVNLEKEEVKNEAKYSTTDAKTGIENDSLLTLNTFNNNYMNKNFLRN